MARCLGQCISAFDSGLGVYTGRCRSNKRMRGLSIYIPPSHPLPVATSTAFVQPETSSTKTTFLGRKTRIHLLVFAFPIISCVLSTILDTGIHDFNDHLLLGFADPTDRP
jgi:hypothetical protein